MKEPNNAINSDVQKRHFALLLPAGYGKRWAPQLGSSKEGKSVPLRLGHAALASNTTKRGQVFPLALSAFASQKGRAIERYREFVAQGKNQPSPWEQLKNQVFLGSDAFVTKMQAKLDGGKDLREIPARQRRPLAKPLHHYGAKATTRDKAIVAAYASGGYSMKEIGDHFGLHYSYVSKIISRATQAKGKT